MFVQPVAFGILLSYELHQDCNFRFKSNRKIRGHLFFNIEFIEVQSNITISGITYMNSTSPVSITHQANVITVRPLISYILISHFCCKVYAIIHLLLPVFTCDCMGIIFFVDVSLCSRL